MKRIISVIICIACLSLLLFSEGGFAMAEEIDDIVTDIQGEKVTETKSHFLLNAERAENSRKKVLLDGVWECVRLSSEQSASFDVTSAEYTENIAVPTTGKITAEYIACRTVLEIKNMAEGDIFLLSLPKDNLEKKLYINGSLAEAEIGIADITDLVVEGDNEIMLLINNIDGDGLIGIEDSITVTVTGALVFENVRIDGDPAEGTVNVCVDIRNYSDEELVSNISMSAYEIGVVSKDADVNRKEAGYAFLESESIPPKGRTTEQITLKLKAFSTEKQWTCDSPYLYEFDFSTENDSLTIKTGIRSFSVDSVTGELLLNSTPVFLSGVSLEDAKIIEKQENLKDSNWIRTFCTRIKSEKMNIIKAKGALPTEWFAIADELGLLILDELPNADLAVLERYNSPSAVIWDLSALAEDEEYAKTAGEKIKKIDGQSRPLNFGFMCAPYSVNDIIECDLSLPDINNENGELKFYPENITWDIISCPNPKIITNFYSNDLAQGEIGEIIEEIRVERSFSGLILPADIVFSQKWYIRNAIAPVGIVIEYFEKNGARGEKLSVDVTVLNDTVADINNLDVTFVLQRDDHVLHSETKTYDSIKQYGVEGRDFYIRTFDIEIPAYITDGTQVTLEAYYTLGGKTVKSSRVITVSGGVPYESPYSTIYVAIVVAACAFLVVSTSFIAFGALKKHIKKTNAQ